MERESSFIFRSDPKKCWVCTKPAKPGKSFCSRECYEQAQAIRERVFAASGGRG